MLLRIISPLLGLVSLVRAQSCSTTTTPALNNLCPTGQTLISTGCCPSANLVASTTASAITCVDKTNPRTGVSDCPAMKSYCTNSAYKTLMTEQCPYTCKICTGGGSTCADVLNSRGVNECPGMYGYCFSSAYLSLMKTQCPKTCGYCS